MPQTAVRLKPGDRVTLKDGSIAVVEIMPEALLGINGLEIACERCLLSGISCRGLFGNCYLKLGYYMYLKRVEDL